MPAAHLATLLVRLPVSPRPLQVVIDAPELVDHLHEALHSHVLKMGQTVPVDFRGEKLKVVVRDFEYLDVDGSASAPAAGSGGAAKPGAGTAGGFEVGGVKFAQFLRSTEVQLRKAAGAATLKLTGSSSGKGSRLFEKGFNFEALGIGGLNREFEDIFRRAFASRVVSPDIMRKMGQKHVRGMLLYGPPGCGKTLIARQIGKALHARKPKVRSCGRGAARGSGQRRRCPCRGPLLRQQGLMPRSLRDIACTPSSPSPRRPVPFCRL
jgi:vesicle-fusing ATPase